MDLSSFILICIVVALIAVPVFLEFRKFSAWKEVERQQLEKAQALARERNRILFEAERSFDKLRKPFEGHLSERQVKILYILYSAGNLGLPMYNLAGRIWGYDGTKESMAQFWNEWCDMCHSLDSFKKFNRPGCQFPRLIRGPIDSDGGLISPEGGRFPPQMDQFYILGQEGYAYLLEHKII